MTALNFSTCRARDRAFGKQEHLIDLQSDILGDDAPNRSCKSIRRWRLPDFYADDDLVPQVLDPGHGEGYRPLSQVGHPSHHSVLDLVRMHIGTAPYDHILEPSRYVDFAIEHEAEVSCVQPSIRLRVFVRTKVPADDIIAAHEDAALHSIRQHILLIIP